MNPVYTSTQCVIEANRSSFGNDAFFITTVLVFLLLYIIIYMVFLFVDVIYDALFAYPGAAYLLIWMSAALLTCIVGIIYMWYLKPSRKSLMQRFIEGDLTCLSLPLWAGLLVGTMFAALFNYIYEQAIARLFPNEARTFNNSEPCHPVLTEISVNGGNPEASVAMAPFPDYEVILRGHDLLPSSSLTGHISIVYRNTTTLIDTPATVSSITSWEHNKIVFQHELTPDGVSPIPPNTYDVLVHVTVGSPVSLTTNTIVQFQVIVT